MRGEEREGYTCYEVWVSNDPEADDVTQHRVIPPAGDIDWLVSSAQLMRRGMFPEPPWKDPLELGYTRGMVVQVIKDRWAHDPDSVFGRVARRYVEILGDDFS